MVESPAGAAFSPWPTFAIWVCHSFSKHLPEANVSSWLLLDPPGVRRLETTLVLLEELPLSFGEVTHVSIVGSVVECSPATWAARVRFPADAIF